MSHLAQMWQNANMNYLDILETANISNQIEQKLDHTNNITRASLLLQNPKTFRLIFIKASNIYRGYKVDNISEEEMYAYA